MSARPIPRQARSRDRVEAIKAATLDVLRAAGADGCTIAAIASASGLTPASIYRYFADASAVVRAVAEDTLEALHEGLVATFERVDSAGAARAALVAAAESYESAFRADRALRELWFGTLADPQLVALNVNDSRRNGTLIARRIAPFSPVPFESLVTRCFLVAHFVGTATGLMLDVDNEAEADRLRAALRAFIEVLFAG